LAYNILNWQALRLLRLVGKLYLKDNKDIGNVFTGFRLFLLNSACKKTQCQTQGL
jgi:hypothetical protein